MDLDAFVTEHGAEWNRLQALAGRRRRRLTPAEVNELVMLYRRTATHLSKVRSSAADPTLVAWLSRLVLQARAAVTPSAGFSWSAVSRFFSQSFPGEVYRAGRWCIGVAIGFIAFSGVVLTIVANDNDVALALFSQDEINEIVNHSFEDYYSANAPQNFAALVWTNNTYISAIALAAGVLFLPTLYVLFSNALNVGIIGGLMVGNGRADVFFGLILVHGMLELTCVFIAAGVGLRVGWAWVAPGRYLTRARSLAQAGRSAMVVALGLAVPLFVSGLVEAFVTPAPLIIPVKLAAGGLVWCAFVGYVVIFGSQATRAGYGSDVDPFERAAVAPTV